MYFSTGMLLFVTNKLKNMKNFIFTLLIMFPIIIQAQVYYNVPLSLSNKRIKCNEYVDGAQIESTANGYKISSILRAKYPISKGKTITTGGKKDEELYVFGNYYFDETMNLIDSLHQFINYQIPVIFTKEFQILDHFDKSYGDVLAEPKDMITMDQTGVIEDGFKRVYYPAHDPGILESFIRKPIVVEKNKEYPPLIYNNDIKMNMVGKIKGFTNSQLTLKNDAERAKAKKAFFNKGIEGEYTAVGKEIKFDHFLDDPKNDKIKLMNSSCHEITGNVIACFSHPEKFWFKEFSFWGFDAEGKVLNSFYKDFNDEQAWPSVAVINDSEPLLNYRPVKQFNYFFPASTGKPLYIITQDKDGKVISEKSYPANVPGGDLLKSKINEDGSQSLLTIARWKAGTTMNSFYLDTDDKLTANSYFLEEKKDPMLPKTIFGSVTRTEIADDNYVSLYQQYWIKKTTGSNTVSQTEENIYEGFVLVTSDKKAKTMDVLHIGKGFLPEGNKNPFTLDSYDAADGGSVVIISRKATMAISSVPTAVLEFVIIQVDKNGNILEKEKIKPAFTRSQHILRPSNVPGMFSTTPELSKQSITVVKLKKHE